MIAKKATMIIRDAQTKEVIGRITNDCVSYDDRFIDIEMVENSIAVAE